MRIENKEVDDERLTMQFICNVLFENKELPSITDLGIKFIQNGGYKNERFDKNIEKSFMFRI